MKQLILSFILATLCGISAFAQDFLQVNASLSKDNISLNMPKSNSQRNGESAIWSCTFEESTPRYTTGQLTASEGNWELQTKSDFDGENYYWALNSTSNDHPHGDYTDTPEHWMMIDPGNTASQGFDFDSYILFTGIDLRGATYPQVCFYEYRRLFNITPSMEATVLEYSLNGGATWTKKVVGCEEAQHEQGFFYRRVPIFEAGGYNNVMIRFRAKRSESLIQSAYGVGYSAGQFIVHWQIDDVKIVDGFSAVCSSGQTLYYTITSNTSPYTVEVIGGNGLSGNLIIPSSVTINSVNYSVTSIGGSAFSGCSGLTSVTIPNSVTSIGGSAFSGCSGLTTVNFNATNCTSMGSNVWSGCYSLSTLNIGENVTNIPSYAFYGCSGLTGTLTIPNSVTSIGDYAFSGCSELTSVTIPNSVTSIGKWAFYNCSGLEEMTIPFVGGSATATSASASTLFGYIFGYVRYDVQGTIWQYDYNSDDGIYAFIPSSLRSVTITGGRLWYGAFENCSMLTSVTIGNSVASIGNYAFNNCSGLTSINFNATNCTSMGGYNDFDYEYRYAFENCTSLSTLNIGENVTNIPANAFSGCSGLTTVNYNATNCAQFGSNNGISGNTNIITLSIGGNVETIPNSAFSGCSGMTGALTIPNSVTSIGESAFYGCSGLSGTLTVPNSVASIGNSAFYNCSGLTTVTVGSGVSNIGQDAFYNCSGLTRVVYTGSIAQWCGISFGNISAQPLSYAHNLYINSSLVTNLVIPNTVEEIKAYAFYNANSLTSVTIPNSVTSIGVDAFYNCSGLTSVTIPNSVTSIGASAFYNCSGLTTVNFNATNCTTMGSSSYPVFQNCNANATINIGEGVTTIPDYAFKGLLGNGILIIPSSVTSIGNSAFSGCSGLTGALTIPNSVTSVGGSAFSGCSGLTSVTIPNSVTSIGASAFYNCSGLTTVNFNATNCTTMGSSSYPVFQNCNANATINIGEGVTTIPDYAFKGLLGNGILIIPSSVTSIGNSAFSGCSGLTGALTIPNSVTSIGGSAFYGCGGLSGTLTVPNSVASIGNSAFSGCNGLTTLNFNAENCTGTISGSLFDSNNTLSKITIGENVATIPNNAFKNCISLDSIISYASNPPVIYASTFDSQLSLNTPVVVPCGMVETYEDADFWYNFRHIQQRADCGATFTITVMSSNSAWGTVSGGGTYMAGETATLTATANEGYTFSNWSDGSTENPHNVVVMADATYIATFVQGGSSNPTVYNSIEATACGSYTWNDHTYTESGEYQQTFTAANSADSIVTLTLTINPAPQPQITLYGELDACNPSSVAFATEQYQSYLWSNGATTVITSTNEPGYYYVEVTGENGCTGISEQVCIGVSNAITEAPQISVVGMNSENRNVVAWSALDNANVTAYRIYRENNVANVYEPMATVEALQTTWTDSTADPTARAYRYKVTAVDECGGESPMSDYHKTMHLTINQGIGNTWNLIWSHYEGFNFGTYRIYRGTSPSNMTMIGEVPSNLNSYTDNTATDNTGFYYQVEVVRNSRSRDAEISSRSNIVDNGIFPEYTITVMSANPNRGTVTGGGTYPEGTVITIEAIANEGYEFVSWSDENTENPRQITVTGDATYIASFDEVSSVTEYTITVMSANPNRGTVTGGGTYAEGTVVRIEATALEGFVFSSWSDENTDNPRYITVTENATYIASFDPATGIEENASLEIALYPNPANDILNITSSETISEIEIVNTLGQVVKRIEVNSDNAVCDVEELKAGVYVVKVSTLSLSKGANVSQRKFIKE